MWNRLKEIETSKDPEAGAVQKQSWRDQQRQNDDTNRAPTPQNGGRSSLRASVIFIGCCLLWSVAVLGVLVNSVLQENIFSILYLGIIFVFVATLKLSGRVSITFRILCGLVWAVVLAGKLTFQVHLCYETAVILKNIPCDKLPVFGADCLQHNYATEPKVSCPLDTSYKDTAWDFLVIFLSSAGAIILFCKFNFMEEWNTKVKKCKDVAFVFTSVVKKAQDKKRPVHKLEVDLNRLFEDGNEQNIFNYFREVPATEDRNGDTKKGKDRLTRPRFHLFDSHNILTVLRTFQALSGINLSKVCRSELSNPTVFTIEDGRPNAMELETIPVVGRSEHSHPTVIVSEDGNAIEEETTTADDAYGNVVAQESRIVGGRNAEGQGCPKVEVDNAKLQEMVKALMIIKNIFKWSVISWNAGFSADPLHAPRIIGLEKSSEFSYLTVHPVILLAALFIQCCIFKCYGTWDTSQQKQYKQDNEQPKQNQGVTTKSESYGSTEPDVYWCALLCDIICFLILIAFSIPGENGNLITYVETQSIPWLYVTVSVVYFLGIIVERILYIRGLVAWKFYYHLIFVIIVHLAIFFGFPWWSQKSFNQSLTSQIWYFVRCIAFAISAYQIKNGYPSHEHVHSFTKNYNFVNKYIFICYKAIPFLTEMRTLLGWFCTKTCLSKGQWFQCEDIYSSLFIVKYNKLREKTDESEKHTRVSRCAGIVWLLVIISLPWVPMALYSILTQATRPNPPTSATLTVSLGGYQPIFQTTATVDRSILQVTDADLETLRNSFGRRTEAGQFLRNKNAEDMSLITFDGVSLSNWGISQHSLENLHNDLLNSAFKGAFQFVVEVRFKRQSDDQHFDDLKGSFAVNLKLPAYTEARNRLRNSLDSFGNSSEVVIIREVFPRFLHLGRQADVSPESRLFEDDEHGMRYSNLSLKYYTKGDADDSWWELEEVLIGSSLFRYEPNGNTRMVPKISFVTFNDRIVTISILSILKTFGIIALYTGVIWAIGRLIRGVFTRNHATLMLSQLDSVDPLLRLVDVLYNRIQHEDLKNQRRLYKLLTSLFADQKRIKEFTSIQPNPTVTYIGRRYSDTTTYEQLRLSGLQNPIWKSLYKKKE